MVVKIKKKIQNSEIGPRGAGAKDGQLLAVARRNGTDSESSLRVVLIGLFR